MKSKKFGDKSAVRLLAQDDVFISGLANAMILAESMTKRARERKDNEKKVRLSSAGLS